MPGAAGCDKTRFRSPLGVNFSAARPNPATSPRTRLYSKIVRASSPSPNCPFTNARRRTAGRNTAAVTKPENLPKSFPFGVASRATLFTWTERSSQ